MKEELAELISQENYRMEGGLIEQSIEGYVEKILKNASIVKCVVQGRIVGFIAYYCNDTSNETAFLTMLCISNDYAGKGLGRRLLNCSIEDIKSKGFKHYELEVGSDNQVAIKLYSNTGFVVTKVEGNTIKMKKEIFNEG